MNHTPGPWEWVPGTCYIWAKDAYEPKIGDHMMVAMANDSEWSDAPAPEGKMTVATARGWGRLQHLGEKRAEAIQDANARLIAAAPELLSQVKSFRVFVAAQYPGSNSDYAQFQKSQQALLQHIDAVLAKVEDEQ